jgi:hypothetical protein
MRLIPARQNDLVSKKRIAVAIVAAVTTNEESRRRRARPSVNLFVQSNRAGVAED